MKKSDNWLLNDIIIHGAKLYSNLESHTSSAFNACMNKGYAIEIDITELSDGNFFVGRDELIDEFGTYLSELSITEFNNHREKSLDWHRELLLLDEFLVFVKGRIPIMLEIKAPIDDLSTADLSAVETSNQLYKKLVEYQHPYCIVSSNPFVLKHLKKRLPDVLYGQITVDLMNYSDVKEDVINLHYKHDYEKVFSADFISCKITDVEKLGVKEFIKKKRCPLIVWPIKTLNDLKEGCVGDNSIIEDIDMLYKADSVE